MSGYLVDCKSSCCQELRKSLFRDPATVGLAEVFPTAGLTARQSIRVTLEHVVKTQTPLAGSLGEHVLLCGRRLRFPGLLGQQKLVERSSLLTIHVLTLGASEQNRILRLAHRLSNEPGAHFGHFLHTLKASARSEALEVAFAIVAERGSLSRACCPGGHFLQCTGESVPWLPFDCQSWI